MLNIVSFEQIGSKASIAPVFAAEAAPDKQRGRVLMTWQLFDALYVHSTKLPGLLS